MMKDQQPPTLSHSVERPVSNNKKPVNKNNAQQNNTNTQYAQQVQEQHRNNAKSVEPPKNRGQTNTSKAGAAGA
jgi:hypothetical protein